LPLCHHVRLAIGGPPDSVATEQSPAAVVGSPAPFIRSVFDAPHPTVFFYHVRNGQITKTVFSLSDLFESPTVELEGYVAGMLVLCEDEMDILVGGVPVRKVVAEADDPGRTADYFGRLDPKGFWNADIANAGALYGLKSSECQKTTVEKYALFTGTALDTVNPGNQFKVVFLRGDSSFELAVHHSGYQVLPSLDSSAGQKTAGTVFRYLGNRAAAIVTSADFGMRVAAIDEGIALVERTFGSKLVHSVNLIDCESVENAITRNGRNDIWFFIDTFRNESVAELKAIATHEALHLLVDRYRFTQAHRVRELYAELKGYDEFSSEWFLLFTRGAVVQEANLSARDHRLFAFVNEKNFLGRKGGHSQDNLDEFCTSFLHSLLFISRIDRNLNLPLIPHTYPGDGRLSGYERSEILEYYHRSIRIFQNVVSRQEAGGPANDFFQKRHAYIDELMRTTRSSMSPRPGPS
jgi:hypothetical protein